MSQVALVTGAARGIGAATVAALARQGWSVVAFDRASDDARLPYSLGTRSELDQVASATGAVPIVGDAANPLDVRAATDLAEREFGGLTAIVAGAGVIAGGVPLWEMPQEQEAAVMEVNLTAVMVAARVGIPALLRQPEPRQGRFIAIASAAATRGLPTLAAYCAAKAGVVGLVHALATELRGTGVTANAVSPGSTSTAILDESARLYDLPGADAFAGQQPLDRLIAPEEVAAAICWLASSASSAVTGIAMPVDGGLAL